MKQKRLLLLMALFLCLACNDSDIINIVDLQFEIMFPSSIKDKKPRIESGTLILENINTGEKITQTLSSNKIIELKAEDGVYNIQVKAEVSYTTKDNSNKGNNYNVKKELRGFWENLTIRENSFSKKLALSFYSTNNTFVISEVYFSFSKTPEGKIYSRDQFIELYNNTDKTLYADGLCIGETKIKTSHFLENFSPDIRNEAVPIRTVYRITGSGKEHPVKPGETFVFCDAAINHKEHNPISVNLTEAQFEWYDDYKGRDIDVPEVPNMERLVKEYERGLWKLFSRGEHSYVLFRVPLSISAKQFSENQKFQYSFTLKGKQYTKDIWKIENDKIIDAVECSTPSGFEWKAISPTLDLTWTNCGDGDKTHHGKSIKRKISHITKNDRIVLQDTNDSASDFIATAPTPSPGKISDHK